MKLQDWLLASRQRIDSLDARLLLEHVTGFSHTFLIAHPETRLSQEQEALLEPLLKRREAGEPLAYLVGQTGFMNLVLKVSPDVLIPRPETEELVELALKKLENLPDARILDLGTGSGAIPIALALALPQAHITAVDISAAALTVARENGDKYGARINWQESDWFSALAHQRFHLIVSNPPYIHPQDQHLSGDGLRFEPRMALTDGTDGFSCIRRIVSDAPPHLEPGGWLFFEHGWDQGEQSRNLLALAGFKYPETRMDLAGHERISGGQWPEHNFLL